MHMKAIILPKKDSKPLEKNDFQLSSIYSMTNSSSLCDVSSILVEFVLNEQFINLWQLKFFGLFKIKKIKFFFMNKYGLIIF